MNNRLMKGYEIFIKRTEDNDFIGTYTLKEDKDNYKDIDSMEPNEMEFVREYRAINDRIDDEHALFIAYDEEDKKYFVSIQEKFITGEYNDHIVWNHIIVSKKKNLLDALNRLDEKVQTKLERSFSK